MCDYWAWNCLLFSDLHEPTVDCSRDETYRVAIIASCSIIGLLVVMGIVISVALCFNKSHKDRQKTKRRAHMSDEEKQNLRDYIKELQKDLLEALGNKELDKTEKNELVEEIKKNLDLTRGIIAGDGSINDNSDEN